MDKKNKSRGRKRKQDGVENESSSSKVAKHEDPVEGTLKRDKLSEDASVLFSHFPEEIWLLITHKVTNSESLTNLMQASPVLRNLLMARRVEFLFPQVWKVLGIKFENNEDEVYSYDFDEIFPDGDLSRNDNGETPWFTKILTLRLVCKSWCGGVDEFYENLPSNEHYHMLNDQQIDDDDPRRTEYNSYGERLGEWAKCLGGIEPDEAEDFMEHFDPTHFDGGNQRNPIIGRYISIFSSKDGSQAEALFTLLSKYGHHIWFCDLDLTDDFHTNIECYTSLKKILQLLPNLKTLKVQYCTKHREWPLTRSWRVQNTTITSDREGRQLKQVIDSNPLPKLLQLQFLSIANLPPCFFNAFVAVNTHISMLEVVLENDQEGYEFYSIPMPNLKHLSMQYFSKEEFEKIQKPEVNWPLQKLYLNLRYCRVMPWSEIFSLLEKKWAETLTNVVIVTPNPEEYSDHIKITDEDSTTTLNLPKLKRFRFITGEICTLDFMLPLKSLEFLEVGLRDLDIMKKDVVKRLRLMKQNQLVQFVGYFNSFHNSNIWNLFPNLKKFKLGDCGCDYGNNFQPTCTRDEAESATRGQINPSSEKNLWYG